MRKILLVVATVMCMGGAFAQLSMGPKLGLNVSSLTGDGSNFRAGMNVGIFANYRINKLLAIQPEFYYSMQGAGFDDIPVLTKTLESNYTSHKAKTFDFSLALGVGYEFDFGMTIDARYNFGLSNVYDEEGSPNNTMFMLSLGYKFDL